MHPRCPDSAGEYVSFRGFIVPLVAHANVVGKLQGLAVAREELGVFDDSGKGAVDSDCGDAFGIHLFQVELLVFGEVLHVGFVSTQLAHVLLLEDLA